MTEEERVLELLRHGLGQVDPVPEHVIRAAEAGWIWRTIDEELAALTHDSSTDPDPALMRGSEGVRLLTFESPRITVEVELGEDRSLTGQIVPPQPAHVDLQHNGSVVTSVLADETGMFFLEGVPTGPIALACRAPDDPPSWVVRTEWMMP